MSFRLSSAAVAPIEPNIDDRRVNRRSSSWRGRNLFSAFSHRGKSVATLDSIPEDNQASDPEMPRSPPRPRLRPFVEVFDELGPKAQMIPSWAAEESDRRAGEGQGSFESLRDFRNFHGDWSTRVFPSSRDVIQGAINDRNDEMRLGAAPNAEEDENKRSNSSLPTDTKSVPLTTPADPTPDLHIPERNSGNSSRFWASFAYACTFFIPDKFIRRDGDAAKQAWREKVATCVIAFLTSAFFVGFFGLMPLFICEEDDLYTMTDIYEANIRVLERHEKAWTVIHGNVYDVKALIHPGKIQSITDNLGKDASRFFPRMPWSELGSHCINATSLNENSTTTECTGFTDTEKFVGTDYCHNDMMGRQLLEDKMGKYKVGQLSHSEESLASSGMDYMIIKDHVYDLSEYDNTVSSYLVEDLQQLIKVGKNTDATDLFEARFDGDKADEFQACLDEQFFMGVMNEEIDPVCATFNNIMIGLLVFVALILILQCLCSLLYIVRRSHTLSKDMLSQQVMVMVPCYNEGDKELKKTIKSVVDTEFPGDNKVLLVVADGVITGRGESMSTPETLSKILGFQMNKDEDTAHEYKSIGSNEKNCAFVYHGTHHQNGKDLKYIVIVKCGTEDERSSPRAGNRGKRDSQLIIAGLFNRVSYGRKLCELDIAICRALHNLNIPADDLKYLMAIDADTRVHKDSMSHMIYTMEQDERILACCGETKVDNKAQSWVTMIQVYEYYSSHHLKKAFESAFGCVTCLPGCFTMYRLKTEDDRPLLACDYVFGNYARNDIESLHDKNLYHLGEDRMLTTLLLQHHSNMKLSFVPEAICWTIVPHTFKILLSQRRRWINSTLHNMFELLKVNTMCGICFISMKTIVVVDMIATAILPASMIYAGFFIYQVVVTGEAISETIILVYALIIGCQVLIFLLRSRWDYLFWFLAYCIFGVPVFYFFLPLYSFWHMDDLSWGQTRQVQPSEETTKESQESNELHEEVSEMQKDENEACKNMELSTTEQNMSKPSSTRSMLWGGIDSKTIDIQQSDLAAV